MPAPSSLPAPLRGGLLALALALGCAASAAAQADPGGVADQVRRHGDYEDQLPVAASEDLGGASRTFPGGATAGGGGGGAGDRALGGDEGEGGSDAQDEARDHEGGRSERSGRSPSGLPMAGGGSILLWLGVALLVGVLIFVLISIRPKGGALAEPPPRPSAEEAPAAPPGLTVVAGDPDELARAGHYEAAIAALLLAALREVGWRPEGLMRSRTAREIVASVSDARRTPLRALVSIQERVAFGGDEATEERWEAAKRELAALRAAPGAAP